MASLASSNEIKIFRTDRHSGGEKQCEIYNLAERGKFGCLTVNSKDVPGKAVLLLALSGMFADQQTAGFHHQTVRGRRELRLLLKLFSFFFSFLF